MAKARMLHNKISTSIQVNNLSLPARLLFTWLISHADDEGRLRGEPESVKAKVLPMTKYSFRKIEDWLKEIESQGLIFYWDKDNEKIVEFVKWSEHQTIRKDRFTPSRLPKHIDSKNNQPATNSEPNDNQDNTQDNVSESKSKEVKKSEQNSSQPKGNLGGSVLLNPKSFQPTSNQELAMFEAWRQLEPLNPLALSTTYNKALKMGLPADKFYQFASEIKQDKSILNKGAVFNSKVNKYFNK